MADTNNDNVVEDAKAKAAARRRRILEAGQSRMDVVSGNGAAETEENPSPTKSSSSNRLAQMRRRRFKANKAAVSTTSTIPKTATGDEPKFEPKEEKPDVTVEKTEKIETVAVETKVEEDEDTRKYMGVAKMRRRRLAEQKAASSSTLGTTDIDSSAKASSNSPISLVSGHSKIPVLMQLITIIMLFVSGLDAGFSSRANKIQTDLYVPTWAGGPKKEHVSTLDDNVAFRNMKEQRQAIYQEESQEDTFAYSKDEDEFGGIGGKPSGADENGDTKVINIDPLFQLDLDAITAGYTGIFGMIIQTAIYFHRLNLYFLYEIPKSIFWDMPKRWLSAPPILFMLALVIRLVGKHLLSAQIPELEGILTNKYDTSIDNSRILESGAETGNASKIADAIDPGKMTSMASNFVKNYVQTNFPSIYFIFTALRDVRQDMYVVLCGVLLGMIMKTSDPDTLIIPLTTSAMGISGEL